MDEKRKDAKNLSSLDREREKAALDSVKREQEYRRANEIPEPVRRG